ncbi:MAG: hypothetical protein RIS47_1591 [Bacteroidota bacterium]
MYINPVNNRIYQHVKLPVYVFISNTPNKQDAVGMSQTDNAAQKNELTPCYLDGEGKHTIRHEDEIEHQSIKFFVWADGTAPKSTVEFKGAQTYKNATTRFYGPGLTVSLKSTDAISGVEQLYQSVNAVAYTPYQSDIDFGKENEYLLKFYAADHVGNMENVHDYKFTVDTSTPETMHKIDGLAQNDIICKYTKITLEASDKLSGVAKTFYQLDNSAVVLYPGGPIPLAQLTDGNHTLTYFSLDNVGNKENAKEYKFYLDKEAPVTIPELIGDQYKNDLATYVSGRTKVQLTASDNKSGVKRITYSIDNAEFQEYTAPFVVPQTGGAHVIRYVAEDNMTNSSSGVTSTKSLRLFVDMRPPVASHRFSGAQFSSRDTLFIREDTDLSLLATDEGSGIHHIGYKIDGGNEQKFEKPINITKEGMHKVTYTAYDNVNNAQTKEVTFIVDNTGPVIYEHFSILPIRVEAGLDVYPPYVMIFLAATDGATGSKTIYYRINNAQKKVYNGNIVGLPKNSEITVDIEAEDQLGNKVEKSFKFKTE